DATLTVRGNHVLLVWALENLLKNALDALAGRGGRIRVAARRAEDGWVRLYVADTGPGIPGELRDRIFDPGVTSKAGGWGVGLSLVRRIIVNVHGGRIVARPRRGAGTVFEIELPGENASLRGRGRWRAGWWRRGRDPRTAARAASRVLKGMMSDLDDLNPEQREAVEHVDGPLLVLAGAGSGKTRVLTVRIAHLVREHGVDPASLLAVTFTNKAAAEMRERVRRLLGAEPAGIWIGTFHSMGARLLRRHAAYLGWSSNFSIFDGEQAVREVKRVMERRNLPVKQWHPKAVHAAISSAKNQLVSPEEYAATARDAFSRVVAAVYPEYQAALKEQNAFDFDDLLVKPVELFLTHEPLLERYRARFQFVLVDEYQDTNHAQYRFIELLVRV